MGVSLMTSCLSASLLAKGQKQRTGRGRDAEHQSRREDRHQHPRETEQQKGGLEERRARERRPSGGAKVPVVIYSPSPSVDASVYDDPILLLFM